MKFVCAEQTTGGRFGGYNAVVGKSKVLKSLAMDDLKINKRGEYNVLYQVWRKDYS